MKIKYLHVGIIPNLLNILGFNIKPKPVCIIDKKDFMQKFLGIWTLNNKHSTFGNGIYEHDLILYHENTDGNLDIHVHFSFLISGYWIN